MITLVCGFNRLFREVVELVPQQNPLISRLQCCVFVLIVLDIFPLTVCFSEKREYNVSFHDVYLTVVCTKTPFCSEVSAEPQLTRYHERTVTRLTIALVHKTNLGGQYMKFQRIEGDPDWPGSGRYVLRYVDSQLLSSWLHKSPVTYSLALENFVKLLSYFQLIDIEQQCLIYNPPDVEYDILSYVWGRLERNFLAAVLKENLTSLERHSGTSPGKPLLPLSIRDAMVAIQGLQQRYLWVDSLCTV